MKSRPRTRTLSRKIRVLVVDDSSYNRQALSDLLQSRDSIEVIGIGRNGEDALKKVIQLKPDIVTLDLEMPVMDGFTFLRIVMQSNPLPVIVVSSRDEDRSVFRAMELGAVDFIRKPGSKTVASIQSIEEELFFKIENIVDVKTDNIRFPGADLRSSSRNLDPVLPPLPLLSATKPLRMTVQQPDDELDLVAIGASTGGPSAIQYLLQNWPEEIIAPVVIAQHMPPGFTKHFSERLGRLTGLDVREATDDEKLSEGAYRIAPGGQDMIVHRISGNRYQVNIVSPSPGAGFTPNVDRLFESVTKACGNRALALVLTGMGNDGAKGALRLHQAGSSVIAEAETSAVVYGMPRETVQIGAADTVAPLDQIPAQMRLFGTKCRKKNRVDGESNSGHKTPKSSAGTE